MPSKKFLFFFHVICVVIVFLGAITPSHAAWALADITMGGMTLINIPSIFLLRKTAFKALHDYEKQRQHIEHPVFHAKDIGIKEELDFWE